MNEQISNLDPVRLSPETFCLLLDFDGTLVAIADRPEDLVLPKRTLEVLESLRSALGGAVAIVSGRTLEDIDRFFAPSQFAAAGTHGLERRDSGGRRHRAPFDEEALDRTHTRLRKAFMGEEGVFIERKTGSLALHFRQRPDLAENCLAEARKAATAGERLLEGKMVVEIAFGRQTKADAVREFLREAPFEGRMPIYAGDDVTDEDAFAAVAEAGGVSIKIGPGSTAADIRLDDPAAFAHWLEALDRHLGGRRAASQREVHSK